MHYTAYTVEDFVQDPYFRRWVKNPDQACEAFWQQFMCEHPEKTPALEEAREILIFLSYEQIESSAQEQEELKSRILQEIGAANTHSRPLLVWRKYYKAAAIFIGLAICALLFTLLKEGSQATSIRTQYAQTRKVLLPDGSSVMLNANSTLRFSGDWAKTHTREVWLEGEAFFEVRKKPEWANARFTVHTDGLQVEVLGTTFNVNTRRGKVKVVLNTGKVKLKPEGSPDSLTMQPKDLVEFTPASKAFIKKKVNPEEHSSWRTHTLLFNESTLQEIAGVLEDIYGVTVHFEEPELQHRKFTGAVPNQDLPLFLDILSQSMSIQMVQSKDSVYITH